MKYNTLRTVRGAERVILMEQQFASGALINRGSADALPVYY